MKITVKEDGSIIIDGMNTTIFNKGLHIESFNPKAKHAVKNCTFIGGEFDIDIKNRTFSTRTT